MGLSLRKAKGHPPVCPHRHGPSALAIPFERMQPKGGLVQVLSTFRRVQSRQDQPQPVNLVGLQLAPVIFFKQQAQTLVPESRDSFVRL